MGEVFFCPQVGGLVCDPCRLAQRLSPVAWVSHSVLQALGSLPNPTLSRLAERALPLATWLAAERLLRRVLELHADREIRSAGLLVSCYPVPVAETLLPASNGQGSPVAAAAFSEEDSESLAAT